MDGGRRGGTSSRAILVEVRRTSYVRPWACLCVALSALQGAAITLEVADAAQTP